jgi:hypothetical protein
LETDEHRLRNKTDKPYARSVVAKMMDEE